MASKHPPLLLLGSSSRRGSSPSRCQRSRCLCTGSSTSPNRNSNARGGRDGREQEAEKEGHTTTVRFWWRWQSPLLISGQKRKSERKVEKRRKKESCGRIRYGPARAVASSGPPMLKAAPASGSCAHFIASCTDAYLRRIRNGC